MREVTLILSLPQNLIRANSLVVSMAGDSLRCMGMPTSESLLVARSGEPRTRTAVATENLSPRDEFDSCAAERPDARVPEQAPARRTFATEVTGELGSASAVIVPRRREPMTPFETDVANRDRTKTWHWCSSRHFGVKFSGHVVRLSPTAARTSLRGTRYREGENDMKFGMLHLFENPVGKSEYQIVKEQFDLMRAAEDLGFDSIWPAEHHFTEYGYCASPALSLAAVASVTKRIRLGTGVVVLPFHNPIRVAEELAMLDLMSDGRLDFGVGRGYQPLEFKGFQIDQAKSRGIFNESLEVIMQAWTQERVNFKGV